MAVTAVVAGVVRFRGRKRPKTERFHALTGDSLILCGQSIIDGRSAPGDEIARVPCAEIVRRDSTSGMLVITMHERELWVRSYESLPLRDALRMQ